MPIHRMILAVLALSTTPLLAQQSAPPALDFDYFRERVQPIFTTKRDGNARCVTCHSIRDVMHLQPLAERSATWNEADARSNFIIASAYVVPGNPDASRLLLHPLAETAGGDDHHDGGKHWTSKNDPEWQTLAA